MVQAPENFPFRYIDSWNQIVCTIEKGCNDHQNIVVAHVVGCRRSEKKNRDVDYIQILLVARSQVNKTDFQCTF